MQARRIAAAVAVMVISSAGAFAQQSNAPAASPAPGASAPQPGPGPGPGRRMGPHFGRDYTPGWSMMTQQEREEHRQRMLGAKTAEECREIRDEHRKLMAERAKERGITMRGPRRDACAGFRKQ